MFIGRVTETFDIEGRGVVVVTDTQQAQLPRDIPLKIGDPIELRSEGTVVLRTEVAGIEHSDPWQFK